MAARCGSAACHAAMPSQPALPSARCSELRGAQAGLAASCDTYAAFDEHARETKRGLLEFLINAKRAGKRVVGYGAPGKGNTLLNYCGIRTDFLDYTVDRNPYKQGKFLPGTHIPIFSPDHLRGCGADYILILPWNLKEEIVDTLRRVPDLHARFVVPIPKVEILG